MPKPLQNIEVRTLKEKMDDVELSKAEELRRSVRLSGQCAGAVTEIKPAKAIVEEMVQQAAEQLQRASTFILQSKL